MSDSTSTTGADGQVPAPFVVGAGGSGTTTLRLMLDSHPQLAVPPETHFLPTLARRADKPGATAASLATVIHGDPRWGDFGFTREELEEVISSVEPLTGTGVARAFYRRYADRHGKPRWGDKTPVYVKSMRRIQRLLPEAYFIHLIRDGRDVRLSRLNRVHEPPPIENAARRWRRRIERARRISADLNHYMEARFEDLIMDPEPTLRRICEFVSLDYDPVMLDYWKSAEDRLQEMAHNLPAEHNQKRRPGTRLERKKSSMKPPDPSMVGKWKSALSEEDIATYEAESGELLAELGYEVGTIS
ncbi:MAG: sulfotransferase family protein [Solirubrobacterales bacterium]